MDVKDGFAQLARGPGRALYAASAPVLKALCATGPGRASVEAVMRGGGRALLWAFDGEAQETPEAARAEWERILRGIGLTPEPDAGGCTTCFARCTLELGPGERRTCDTVMAINDELLGRLGARMELAASLASGDGRCVVRVGPKLGVRATLPGEAPLWCAEDEALDGHFDGAAGFYDWIMGYWEVPANREAVRDLALPEGAKVLELGVGTGLGLLSLLGRLPPGAHVTAVDRSRGMLARTRARLERRGLASRVTLVHGDGARTGLPDASCDAVYSSFLLDLHDVPKRRALLREARRVLAPGGEARFVVMDAAPEGRADRALTALYNAGYGRWNPVWKALLDGYAPHCRPVRLGELLREEGFGVLEKRTSHVTAFPVAIWIASRDSRG